MICTTVDLLQFSESNERLHYFLLYFMVKLNVLMQQTSSHRSEEPELF